MRWWSWISALLLVVLVAAPAHAALRRIYVDAGARTAALAQLLRDEGGVEIAPEASAEVRVVLREAGLTWTLVVLDRAGRRVLRRDIGAAGGDLAALRVTALLVEQAVRGRRVEPEPPVARTATVAVRSSTVGAARATAVRAEDLGTVRVLPSVPIAPSAASLLANAAALPRSSTAALARAREEAAADSPDGPRIAGLRRRRASAPPMAPRAGEPKGEIAAAEGRAAAGSDGPAVAAKEGGAAGAAGPVATDGPVAAKESDSAARAEEPVASDGPTITPPESPPDASVAAPPESARESPPDARGDDEPAALADRASPFVAASTEPLVTEPAPRQGWRLVASVAARWWQNPGDVPQLGFGAGAEGFVGSFLLGGTVKLAGAPCCERTTDGLTASVYEIGLAAYGLLSLLRSSDDRLTLYGSAEIEGAVMTGQASLAIGLTGSTGTPTDLQGFSATLAVGPALELRLSEAFSLRLRASVRVSMAVYEIDSGDIPGDPLHTGWVHPYIDVALPISL